MKAIWRFLVVAVLALAVVIPPRLHALASVHDHGTPQHAAGSGAPQHVDCHDGAAAPQHAHQPVELSMCLTACACLPAAVTVAERWMYAGRSARLVPASPRWPAGIDPSGLFRPPRAFS